MIESKLLLDSSAWLEYFLNADPQITEMITKDSCMLFASAISLHEVKKRLLLAKMGPEMLEKSMSYMRDNSIVLDVSEEILEKSADDSVRLGLALADSIIYRSALDIGAQIVTFDVDFSGKKGAMVMK